jgi:hypothetical protein
MELKKLIIAQLVREPTPFGNPEGLLLYSQQPATSHYPEPDESSPQNKVRFSNIPASTCRSPKFSLACRVSHYNRLDLRHILGPSASSSHLNSLYYQLVCRHTTGSAIR